MELPKLFRDQNDQDLRWSHVGPKHERAHFNLITPVGYAPERGDNPPFHIYIMGERKLRQKTFATIPAAKRAGRKFFKSWILEAAQTPLTWRDAGTGVHFVATASSGVQVANYYYCPKPIGTWHEGFRVWFGGTYYLTTFQSPEEARVGVNLTWEKWLKTAHEKLLP